MTANLTKRPRALKAGVRRFSAAALMSAVGAIPDYAFAQAQQAAESEPASTESDIAAGLALWVDAATTFSDNIFATQNDKAADFIFSLEPGAKLSIGGKSAGVTIRGEGEVARYDRNTGEDYDDWSASVETRARISRDFLLIGGGEYQWEHESRTSHDAHNSLEIAALLETALHCLSADGTPEVATRAIWCIERLGDILNSRSDLPRQDVLFFESVEEAIHYWQEYDRTADVVARLENMPPASERH